MMENIHDGKRTNNVGYGNRPSFTLEEAPVRKLEGRKKGTRNFKTDLIEELAEVISVRERGIARSVTKTACSR